MMGLTIHPSDVYDAFSSYGVSVSLLLSLMKMSLTNTFMNVLGLGSPPVHTFISCLELSVDRVS